MARGMTLIKQGDRISAAHSFETALAERQVLFGGAAPQTVKTLFSLGNLFADVGDFEQASRYFRNVFNALDTNADAFGPSLPSTWAYVARHFLEHGQPAEAEVVCNKFVQVQSTIGQDNNLLLARTYYGRALDAVGKFELARHQLVQALESASQLSVSPPELEFVLRSYIDSCCRRDAHQEAVNSTRELIELIEGQQSYFAVSDRAYAYGLQAIVLLRTGELLGALSAGELALKLYQDCQPGVENVKIHELLADIYIASNNRPAALPHLRAVANSFAEDDSSISRAHALAKLGTALLELHKPSDAKPILEAALKIHENSTTPITPSSVSILNALGNATSSRQPAEAEKLLRKANEGVEQLQRKPPQLARMVKQNLSINLIAQKKFAEAEKVLGEIELTENGEPSIETLQYFMIRAEACLRAGSAAEAERLLSHVLKDPGYSVWSSSEMSYHANLSLVVAQALQGNYISALNTFLEIDENRLGTLSQSIAVASDIGRRRQYEQLGYQLSLLLTIAERVPSISSATALKVLEFVIRRKSIAPEIMALRRSIMVGAGQPEEALKRELKALYEEAAKLELTGSSKDDDEANAYISNLYGLRKQILGLEERLGSSNLLQNRLLETLSLSGQNLLAVLDHETALIEFVKYSQIRLDKAFFDDEQKDEAYLAIVISGVSREGSLCKLGSAALINKYINDLGRSIDRGRGLFASASQLLQGLMEVGDTSQDPTIHLHRLLIVPLLPYLETGTRNLILAPDGELRRLPFGALLSAEGRHFGDSFRLSYLTSGRELVLHNESTPSATRPVVFGAPDFEWRGTAENWDDSHRSKAAIALDQRNLSGDEHISADGNASLRTGTTLSSLKWRRPFRGSDEFSPLPATVREAEIVGKCLGVPPLLRREATRAKFLSLNSPIALHVATHGYFLASDAPEGWGPASEGDIEAVVAIAAQDTIDGRLSLRIQNPFLRSGLAMVGANAWLRFEATSEDVGSGLVSAEDITRLELSGTELVVLSACETGLGDMRIGEGVLGLQRAIAIAGAKTLVMSLWKVPDDVTCMLMERFYDSLLKKNQRIDQALTEAQNFIRNLSLSEISERVSEPGYMHDVFESELRYAVGQPESFRPFNHEWFWAGFICAGDMRPLSKRAGWNSVLEQTEFEP